MTDTDTLLSQALALVNEDHRGQLADIIESVIAAAQAAPTPDWLQAARDWRDAYADYDFIRGDPTATREMIEGAYNDYQWQVQNMVSTVAKFDPPVEWPMPRDRARVVMPTDEATDAPQV